MISFTNTIHVNRPPEAVYAYMADLEHTPDWNWAITDTTKITAGPVAVGTRYAQTRSVPRPGTEMLEITTLENGRHIEVQGTLARFTARLNYHIEQEDEGAQLTNTVNLETQGALRLISPMLGSNIKRAVADNLNELKARLETRTARAT